MPRAIAASSPPPVSTCWPFLPIDDRGAGVLAHRQHAAGRDVGVLQQVEGDEAVVGRRLGVVEDARAAARGGRAGAGGRCRASPARVSSVSASGSTCRNRRPPASNVDTPSVVSRRYGVSSGAEREQLLVGELGSRRTVALARAPAAVKRVAAMDRDYRIEHDSMGEVGCPPTRCGGRRPSGRSRTSRSRGTRHRARRTIARAGPDQGGRRRRQRRARGARPTDVAERDRATPPPRSPTGEHDDQFPIDVFQTGSGTSSNMNTNEVIATPGDRAARAARCTPTTTSTPRSRRNDVFPSADPRRRDRARSSTT